MSRHCCFCKYIEVDVVMVWGHVLPVPVAALAQISLPSKAIGIVLACIGVGLTNPRELTACKKYWESNV